MATDSVPDTSSSALTSAAPLSASPPSGSSSHSSILSVQSNSPSTPLSSSAPFTSAATLGTSAGVATSALLATPSSIASSSSPPSSSTSSSTPQTLTSTIATSSKQSHTTDESSSESSALSSLLMLSTSSPLPAKAISAPSTTTTLGHHVKTEDQGSMEREQLLSHHQKSSAYQSSLSPSHRQQSQNQDSEMEDVSMPRPASLSSAVPSTSHNSTVAGSRKRLASPDSPAGDRCSSRFSEGMSVTPTPSPRLPPHGSEEPSSIRSVSPRVRKNSVSGAKKENKVGVTATSCANCGTTTTPLWRRAGNGQTICNACGLYFKARNLTRPPWLKRNPAGKKGEEGGSDMDDVDEHPNPTTTSGAGSGSTPSKAMDGTGSADPSETAAKVEKTSDGECAGSCPGDGNCNGEGGAESCAGCPSFNQHQTNRQHLVCANCSTTTTPLWRRDSGGNTICNACGLYFKLHNVHRPVTMKRAVIKRRKRVNLLANSPPLVPQEGSEQTTAVPTKAQAKASAKAAAAATATATTSQSKQAPPTASDLEPAEAEAQAAKQGKTATKRRKVQATAGPRVPAIEDMIVPKRAANGQTEWLMKEPTSTSTSGTVSSSLTALKRSVSPIENIGSNRHEEREAESHERSRYDTTVHRSSHNQSHNHGAHGRTTQSHAYSHSSTNSQDQHRSTSDLSSHRSSPTPTSTASSSRYSANVHQSNGPYPSSQSMSMSRYPMNPLPAPIRSQPSYSYSHAMHLPHYNYQLPHQQRSPPHEPHAITMQGYQAPPISRSSDMDDGSHSSSHVSSSGWNTRLPGYATMSLSSSNTRLSSTGIVHSSNAHPSSPPMYPRHGDDGPSRGYSYYSSVDSPSSHGGYHRSQSPTHESRSANILPPPNGYGPRSSHSSGSAGNQGSISGSGHHTSNGGRSGYGSSYGHRGLPSLLNPIHGSHDKGGDRRDNEGSDEQPHRLPPISMPHSHSQSHHSGSPSQHQPLPRASEILHQSSQDRDHHSSYSSVHGSRRVSSPPVDPSSSSTTTLPGGTNAGSGAATSTSSGSNLPNKDVLQQTREDLQREVSHLSMLLGRAAAVLNGLDQALGSNGGNKSSSAPSSSLPVSAGESSEAPASAADAAALVNDLKTSSALASLMALSASGDRVHHHSSSSASSQQQSQHHHHSQHQEHSYHGSHDNGVDSDRNRSIEDQHVYPPPPPPPLHRHAQALPYPLPRRE
ncbi:GATA-binding protein, other eukaryote [Entomortierella parvispora]|uniref:GATA-binding protein, other eukaryote n=1 Tax=Entomortierella parvispora TaxID=205924 RepID=A0A9P3LVR0_9FUNG|nr:GATA-binding protein, other eukaryote [Entomortierella parvispora]